MQSFLSTCNAYLGEENSIAGSCRILEKCKLLCDLAAVQLFCKVGVLQEVISLVTYTT